MGARSSQKGRQPMSQPRTPPGKQKDTDQQRRAGEQYQPVGPGKIDEQEGGGPPPPKKKDPAQEGGAGEQSQPVGRGKIDEREGGGRPPAGEPPGPRPSTDRARPHQE